MLLIFSITVSKEKLFNCILTRNGDQPDLNKGLLYQKSEVYNLPF